MFQDVSNSSVYVLHVFSTNAKKQLKLKMFHFVSKCLKKPKHTCTLYVVLFFCTFSTFSQVAKHSALRNLGFLLVQLPCGRYNKSYLNAPGSAELQLSAQLIWSRAISGGFFFSSPPLQASQHCQVHLHPGTGTHPAAGL